MPACPSKLARSRNWGTLAATDWSHRASTLSTPRSRVREAVWSPLLRAANERSCSTTSLRRPRARRWLSRSEEHTSELQSPCNLVCRLLLEKKKTTNNNADGGREPAEESGRTRPPAHCAARRGDYGRYT